MDCRSAVCSMVAIVLPLGATTVYRNRRSYASMFDQFAKCHIRNDFQRIRTITEFVGPREPRNFPRFAV